MTTDIPNLEYWIQIYLFAASNIEAQRTEAKQIVEEQISDNPDECLQTILAISI